MDDTLDVVVAGLMRNSHLLAQAKNVMDPSYFPDSYKIIYKSLVYYFSKYDALPTDSALKSVVDEITSYTPDVDPLKIKAEIDRLSNLNLPDERFVADQVTKFVHRKGFVKVLGELVEKSRNNMNPDLEKAANELQKYLSTSFSQVDAFRLDDSNQLQDIRMKLLGDQGSPFIIKSCIPSLNSALLYKGYKVGDLVMVVAAPGVGKTSFLVNEGVCSSRQGFNVLHIFLGDMSQYDGFIRYTSCITGIPQDDLALMPLADQIDLVKSQNLNGDFSRISLYAFGAGELTVNQLIEVVKKSQEVRKVHYNVIIVDYADNLVKESDESMYESGGVIYNKLSWLAFNNRSVVLVASQPKINFWNQEIIPLEGAAESSRKQHVVDLMISFGKVSRGSSIGSLFLAKVRRGQVGRIIRVKTDWSICRISEISEPEYCSEKAKNVDPLGG